MVLILICPLKLPWDSHLSTFITEGSKGKEKKKKKKAGTLLKLFGS